MPKITVGLAMTLLIIGNIIGVFSDALIKTLPADTATYQFVLFRQLTAVLILFPFVYSVINKASSLASNGTSYVATFGY